MTTGIYNTGYNDYYNQYNLQNTGIQNNNQNVSFTSNEDKELAQEMAKKKKKIEKDDGSIGFGKAALNFAKGVGKFFTGMFTDEQGNFSIGQTLKTAAIAVGVGAVTVLTAGTAVPAMIAAAGIGISAIGIGKSAINIATADTDAEAEAAWQSLGANTTAGALALAGAKAVAKSSAANPAEFDGVTGYFKAGKQVFKDSGNAIADSFTGFKSAYKGAGEGFSAKTTALKNEYTAQKDAFTGKVTENYNKAVYGTKEKISEDSTKLDKEIKEKTTEKNKIKNKNSEEYKKAETEINRLTQKRNAIDEMNKQTSWEKGNEIITNKTNELAQKKAELAKATTDTDKTRLSNEIKNIETQLNASKQVLARRTREAQHIQNKINEKQKSIDTINKQEKPDATQIAKLQKEITELKARQDFELPNGVTKEEVTASNKDLKELEQKTNEAIAKQNELEAESSTNDRAYAQLEKAERNATTLKEKSNAAKSENAKLNAKYNAQEGTGYDHVAREIGSIAYNQKPEARWLTVGIAGKQFGYKSKYSDLYSQLTAQDKAYFKSLTKDQKEAILTKFNEAIA